LRSYAAAVMAVLFLET